MSLILEWIPKNFLSFKQLFLQRAQVSYNKKSANIFSIPFIFILNVPPLTASNEASCTAATLAAIAPAKEAFTAASSLAAWALKAAEPWTDSPALADANSLIEAWTKI